MEPSWEAREPPLASGFREGTRLAVRGARRFVVAMLLPLAGGLYLAKSAYSLQMAHTATVVLSLPPREAFGRNVDDFLRRNMSDVAKQNATYSSAVAYVSSAVITDQYLVDMMHRRPDLADYLKLGDRKGLDKLRDNIIISQFAGGYIGERTEQIEDEAGSQIKIECTYPTYSKSVLGMCVEMATTILMFESRQRLAALSRSLGHDDFVLERMKKDLDDAQQELVTKAAILADIRAGTTTSTTSLAPRSEEEAKLYLEVQELTQSVKDKTTEVIAFEARAHDETADAMMEYYNTQVNAPSSGWALLLVDAGRMAPPKLLIVLFWCGVAGFIPLVFLMPFSFVLVGIFDPVVYDLNDLHNFGIKTIGLVDLGLPKPKSSWWRLGHA